MVDAEYDDCLDCQVHTGFKKCFDRTANSTKLAVLHLHKSYPDFEIVVTGHSLGGAISNLMAVSLVQSGLNISHYSFGSPRVRLLQYILPHTSTS